MSARLRTIRRAAGRFGWLLLPCVVLAAILDGWLGASGIVSSVLDPLAGFAAIVVGFEVRGPQLSAVVLSAATGLAFASQLDPTDQYDFVNDLVFFVVVLVGAPALVGAAIRKRRELVGVLTERARRMSAGSVLRQEELAVAAERGRLQHELDAVLTDRIAEIVVQASGAERAMAVGSPSALSALGQIETAARSVLHDLREVLGVLRVGDEDLALRPAASLTTLDELKVSGRLTLEVTGNRGRLDPAVDATAFRVVREAVAGASARGIPHVLVAYQPRGVSLEITGSGFLAGTEDGIVHRVALFGGRYRRNDDSVTLELPRRVPW